MSSKTTSEECRSAMLYTARGAELDEIAVILGHEPRKPSETDVALRSRLSGVPAS